MQAQNPPRMFQPLAVPQQLQQPQYRPLGEHSRQEVGLALLHKTLKVCERKRRSSHDLRSHDVTLYICQRVYFFVDFEAIQSKYALFDWHNDMVRLVVADTNAGRHKVDGQCQFSRLLPKLVLPIYIKTHGTLPKQPKYSV